MFTLMLMTILSSTDARRHETLHGSLNVKWYRRNSFIMGDRVDKFIEGSLLTVARCQR
jgi:hypothetical protein